MVATPHDGGGVWWHDGSSRRIGRSGRRCRSPGRPFPAKHVEREHWRLIASGRLTDLLDNLQGAPTRPNLTPLEVGNFGEQSWGLSASGIRMRSPRSNRRVAAGESLRVGVVAVRPSTHCRPGGPSSLKTAKDVMDIVNACEATGTYRAAAVLARTTHETVRRVMER